MSTLARVEARREALLAFLRDSDFETLYLVGDLIDIWALRRGIFWPQDHNDVVQKLLRKARKDAGGYLRGGKPRRSQHLQVPNRDHDEG